MMSSTFVIALPVADERQPALDDMRVQTTIHRPTFMSHEPRCHWPIPARPAAVHSRASHETQVGSLARCLNGSLQRLTDATIATAATASSSGVRGLDQGSCAFVQVGAVAFVHA